MGQLREGVQAFLDACTGSDFQQHGLRLLRTWLQQAIDDDQIDSVPVEPLAWLLAALISEASMYIGQAADPARARRETGATIDRILSGLRSGAGR